MPCRVMPKSPEIHESLDLLLGYGVCLMESGAHTSRVERNVSRIAEAFGYEVAVTIFQRTVMISVTQKDNFSVSHTLIRKVTNGTPVNFERISALSALSWEARDEQLTLEQIRERFESIVARERMSRWLVLVLVAVANAAFCRLFEGDAWAMGFVFVATLVAFFLRQEMGKRHVNHMLAVIACAFVASLIAAMSARWHLGSTPSTAVASSVLFMIPGVPLINAVTDILQGYVLLGISRAVNALTIILCITVGMSLSMFLMGIDIL